MIGVAGDVVEGWGVVDTEYLRRFTQALMDPDPAYWDEEYAKSSRYGEVIVPPIMVSYMSSRIRPDQADPITQAFLDDPMSDGIGRVSRPGSLPSVPTNLVAGAQCGQRAGDLPISQHRRQDILPTPVFRHPGTSGPRWQAVPHRYQRDHL